jgi:hypothetical protein
MQSSRVASLRRNSACSATRFIPTTRDHCGALNQQNDYENTHECQTHIGQPIITFGHLLKY